MNFENVVPKINKVTKEIDLIDIDSKDLVAIIESPNLIDANNKINYEDVTYDISQDKNGSYYLILTIKEEYLKKSAYPVIVDPTYVWVTESMIDYRETMWGAGNEEKVLGRHTIFSIINNKSCGSRMYMKFNGMKEKIRGKFIYQCSYQCYTLSAGGNLKVGISAVESDWDSATLKWNNQPPISDQMYWTQSEFTSDGGNCFYLTNWAKDISSGKIDNDYGLAISCAEEEADGYVHFYSPLDRNKISHLYIYYDDIENVGGTYDGSFQLSEEFEEQNNQIKLNWEKYNNDILEYDIYVRKDNTDKFEHIGKTNKNNFTLDMSDIEDVVDIRVIAIQADNENYVRSENIIMSNIITIEKELEEAEGNRVYHYEQTILDTDGDGLEDGYEIWDFKTLWKAQTQESTPSNTVYDLDTDDDGLPDRYEVFILETDPAVANDINTDSDGDGLSDITEYQIGTDPWLVNSDFDDRNDLTDRTGTRKPRHTDSASTNKSVASETQIHKGMYDREYNEIEDGVTITYVKNIYNDLEKSIYYDYGYGSSNLNKKIMYFYDDKENITALIEKYDEKSSERNSQTICITYDYDINGNNTFICDQGTKYTMRYDSDGNLKTFNVGDFTSQNSESSMVTFDINADISTEESVLSSKTDVTTYLNGGKIRKVTKMLSASGDSINATVQTVEIFYDNSNDVSYKSEYNREGKMTKFYDYSSDSNNPIIYTFSENNNESIVSRNDGFIKTVEETENEEEQQIINTNKYKFNDIKNNEQTYITSTLTNTSDSNRISTSTILIDGSVYNDIGNIEENNYTKTLEKGQNSIVKTVLNYEEEAATFTVKSDYNKEYDYKMDKAGNIINISLNGEEKYQYTYDAHGRLLTQKDFYEKKYHRYEYDSSSNVQADNIYNMNQNNEIEMSSVITKSYEYSAGDWKDQLIEYNGQSITYDSVGNPLCYINGMQFTWSRGRLLNCVIKNNEVTNYKYNYDGLRTTKNNSNMIITYEWDDKKLFRETVYNKLSGKTYDIFYIYDTEGNILGFEYDYLGYHDEKVASFVYYEKNMQGDVVGLINEEGNEIASYRYDAWGDVTSSQCVAGNEIPYYLNHILYRGYYKDDETGFYYLQSRYYDSEIGRFINADEYSMLDIQDEVVSKDNLYVYCNCNPVNAEDPEGAWFYRLNQYDRYVKKLRKWYYLSSSALRKIYYIRKAKYKGISARYKHNLKQYRKIKKKREYINGQGLKPYAKMKYGGSRIKNTGCEIIATYNMMKSIGKYKKFPEMIAEFEMNDLDWLYGFFGTNPVNIEKYLKAHKVKYKKYDTKKEFEKEDKDYSYYIVSFWNENPLRYGIHTVFVRKIDEMYYVYNHNNYADYEDSKSDLKSLYMDGGQSYSCIYGIEK